MCDLGLRLMRFPLIRAAAVTFVFKWSFQPSLLPVPHTDTAHTTQRASTRAGLSVCLCKGHSYKELEEFGHQPGTVREKGGGQSGKVTAKNNRDSGLPEAALTSAGPVKGQELRGSDREDRQLHPITTSSPLLGWLRRCDGDLQEAYGAHVTSDSSVWVQFQSSRDKVAQIKAAVTDQAVRQ